MNEDLRQLKDFKTLISEKTVPKSIKILKRTIWILVTILIILTGNFFFRKNMLNLIAVQLSQRLTQAENLREGGTAIRNSILRGTIISDINYEIRRLYSLAL